MKLPTVTVTVVFFLFINNAMGCFPAFPNTIGGSSGGSSSGSSSGSSGGSSGGNSGSNNNLEILNTCECGVPKNESNRIVGGQDADKNEYPWQVALKRGNSRKPFCGGSILSTDTILTAAHCDAYPISEIR